MYSESYHLHFTETTLYFLSTNTFVSQSNCLDDKTRHGISFSQICDNRNYIKIVVSGKKIQKVITQKKNLVSFYAKLTRGTDAISFFPDIKKGTINLINLIFIWSFINLLLTYHNLSEDCHIWSYFLMFEDQTESVRLDNR